ncbi:hypothetical protein BFP97_04680 [Roseivirga sp. 4D4]|nr:hypothetical protein BFP97_04680 [Roseivirga sp. 4D4]
MALEHFLKGKGYRKLQMTRIASGHLHLECTLNGVNGKFILDTGASGTVIEVQNRDKFKMAVKNVDQEAAGAGGASIQMFVSEENTFEMGALTINKMPLVLMSLDHVNSAFERLGLGRVDGVIGADILTSKEAIIDYTNLALYLKK